MRASAAASACFSSLSTASAPLEVCPVFDPKRHIAIIGMLEDAQEIWIEKDLSIVREFDLLDPRVSVNERHEISETKEIFSDRGLGITSCGRAGEAAELAC
jgi:hypothetical protein